MSGDQDIAYASAVSLLDRYRKRALSPVEVTRQLLDRLDVLQPKINAFCVVDRDGALAAARASEQRWTSGSQIGRLQRFAVLGARAPGPRITDSRARSESGLPPAWGKRSAVSGRRGRRRETRFDASD